MHSRLFWRNTSLVAYIPNACDIPIDLKGYNLCNEEPCGIGIEEKNTLSCLHHMFVICNYLNVAFFVYEEC